MWGEVQHAPSPTLPEEKEINPWKLKWLTQDWFTSCPPRWSFEAPCLRVILSQWTDPFPTKPFTSLSLAQGKMSSGSCFSSKPAIHVSPLLWPQGEGQHIALSSSCFHLCLSTLQSLCLGCCRKHMCPMCSLQDSLGLSRAKESAEVKVVPEACHTALATCQHCWNCKKKQLSSPVRKTDLR